MNNWNYDQHKTYANEQERRAQRHNLLRELRSGKDSLKLSQQINAAVDGWAEDKSGAKRA